MLQGINSRYLMQQETEHLSGVMRPEVIKWAIEEPVHANESS